jgi:acyl dehydratase
MNVALYYEDVEIGDEIDAVERIVSPAQVHAFLAIRGSRSIGPSRFTDDAYARGEGLPGAIVPGGLNVAMVSQLLTGWSPTVTLKRLEVVFRQSVPHNAPLQIKGVVTAKHVVDDEPQLECDVFIEDEAGNPLVIGHATVVLPMRAAEAKNPI